MGEDKHYFGIVKVGERGQIIIPKEARDKFDINPGDRLVVVGRHKKETLTLIKEDVMRDYALKILEDLETEKTE